MKYLCGWLNISRSGYYDWRHREESNRSRDDRQLLKKIVSIHDVSRGVYGSPRIHKVLQSDAIRVGKKRVARLMRLHNIQGRVVKVTRRQPGLHQFYARGENLRAGAVEPQAINREWVADITYLKPGKHWLYLATVMDVCSRRIVAWSLGRNKTVELTLGVLKRAISTRKPAPGLIFHTDRGIEYLSPRIRHELERHGIRPSANRPGRCTDNAHMESFFHTLKGELIRGSTFTNDKELRYALNSYINSFYNHRRLHSGINYQAPAQYEQLAA